MCKRVESSACGLACIYASSVDAPDLHVDGGTERTGFGTFCHLPLCFRRGEKIAERISPVIHCLFVGQLLTKLTALGNAPSKVRKNASHESFAFPAPARFRFRFLWCRAAHTHRDWDHRSNDGARDHHRSHVALDGPAGRWLAYEHARQCVSHHRYSL